MRFADWPERLNNYIVEVRDNTYQLGAHDCCTFAAGAVQAITGIDYMPEFRGQYDSEETFIQALENYGQGTLFKTLIHKFGDPVAGVLGRRGDVAYHDNACGVIIGQYAMFISAEGYGLLPITKIQRAFHIQ